MRCLVPRIVSAILEVLTSATVLAKRPLEMNGNGLSVEERMERKRSLEQELELVRNQKAEVLRAIQQIAKKQKTGLPMRSVPMTYEAKMQVERRRHAEELKRIWGSCLSIVKDLLKNAQVRQWFGEPVHADKFPDYYNVIKEPRDLGTIKGQLERREFKDVYEFISDARLCWENCRRYNPLGTHVRKIGDTASDSFEKKLIQRRIEEFWQAEIRRHNLMVAKLEAENKSLPEKVAEVDQELQDLSTKSASRVATSAPGPGRDMTFEEKRKLSHDLTELPGERLGRVLEIIKESTAAESFEGEDNELMELDIDNLDSDTLWKLFSYVETVQTEMRNKAPPPTSAMNDSARQAQNGAASAEGMETTGDADRADGESSSAWQMRSLKISVKAVSPCPSPDSQGSVCSSPYEMPQTG